jgi:hypothetical protein
MGFQPPSTATMSGVQLAATLLFTSRTPQADRKATALAAAAAARTVAALRRDSTAGGVGRGAFAI